MDYHVDVGRHYYAVPYQLLKQTLWARVTARTIEVYFKGQRVASHIRYVGQPPALYPARSHASPSQVP
jgi:hypothetical protein